MDQRALQRFINRALGLCREAGLQQQPEPEGDVSILRGIARCIGDGHAIEGDHRLARTRYILEGDAGVAEVALRELIHAVAHIPDSST